LVSAGHRFKRDDIATLNDGCTGRVAFYLTGAERHPVRGRVTWPVIEGAGASPKEIDAAS
jgi:hypothetical protein